MHPHVWRLTLVSLATVALFGGWAAADRAWGPAADAVSCDAEASARLSDDAILWVQRPGSLTRFDGRWDGEVLRFPGAPASGRGELEVPGYVRTDVQWENHRCLPVAPILAAPVVGSVHPPDGDVVVVGCGAQVEVGPGGSFYLEAAPVPCTLQALRADGALTARGPAVEIHPQVGRDTVVDLSLPDRIGGVGIRFSIGDEGAVVDGVFAGSAAEAAGLAVGDLVVAVNGETTVGMDLADFARAVIGPVGTPVSLTVRGGDGDRRLELLRGAATAP